ncbi:F0F1 ATP synthase subunit A [Patescibacteria group bacterium]|nr:F0F1 ATP synthase subunit A [Patescibacteria group bacterium]MCL5798269.1 F0F1 ATP synthase subunit A [Patescibacteria group bacterium]
MGAENSINISLVAEKLFSVGGGYNVTNAMMTTWIIMFLLVALSFLITRKLTLVPGYLQSIGEIIVEGLWNLFESVMHDKTKIFFPLLSTYFIYIISLNWVELLPGVGTIGLEKLEEGHKVFIPMFRPGTADLNTTLALALIAVVLIQYYGLKMLGASYLKKFFNFKNPIMFFVGLLDLLSEFTKIISFSFRLFGNIFAGDVLLTVIAFLMPLFAPLPFLGLELFVGFIQAVVFSMLTSVFLSVATTKTEH